MGKEYISDIYQEVYHVPYFNLQVNIDNNVTDLLLIENNLYFRPCISLGFGQNNSIGTWLVKKSKILTKVEIHFLYIPYNPNTHLFNYVGNIKYLDHQPRSVSTFVHLFRVNPQLQYDSLYLRI